ncbi:MAG: hypothetical protein ACOYL3_06680 [Desulfuromonadaceae bacterium]
MAAKVTVFNSTGKGKYDGAVNNKKAWRNNPQSKCEPMSRAELEKFVEGYVRIAQLKLSTHGIFNDIAVIIADTAQDVVVTDFEDGSDIAAFVKTYNARAALTIHSENWSDAEFPEVEGFLIIHGETPSDIHALLCPFKHDSFGQPDFFWGSSTLENLEYRYFKGAS